MTENKESRQDKYDFFISYYSATGSHYAKYLKAHSKDFNRSAFLDREDIPKTIEEESDVWRAHVDKGIENSKSLVLIMTLGFNTRPEIKRELKIAFKKGIQVYLFKKDDLENRDLIMKMENGEVTDFSARNYEPFNNECELLAKVENALRGKPNPSVVSSFKMEAERLAATEGVDIKNTGAPVLEIVIGPTNKITMWLPTDDPINADLLSMNSYCSKVCNFVRRRNYYECEPWDKDKPIQFFLRVRPDGFFHLVEPIYHEERYWLDAIFAQILRMMLYSIRVMKYKHIDSKQSICINLKNVQNLEVRVVQYFQRFKYIFSNSDPEPFIHEFNPSDDWKTIGNVIKKMYADFCLEVSFEVDEQDAKSRLRDMIRFRDLGSWTFNGPHGQIALPAVRIEEFGF